MFAVWITVYSNKWFILGFAFSKWADSWSLWLPCVCLGEWGYVALARGQNRGKSVLQYLLVLEGMHRGYWGRQQHLLIY